MSDKRRKTTRRDLPSICLLYGVIFAGQWAALIFSARIAGLERSELHEISGTVEAITHTGGGPKARSKLNLLIGSPEGKHHLTQDDLSDTVSGLESLQVGDTVTALTSHYGQIGNAEAYWEIRRNGAMLLSFEETNGHQHHLVTRYRKMGLCAGAIAVALLILGIAFRRYFGSWYDAT
jgi:hypothetical protein